MKTVKATIDKITVTIGAKKIELTLEEARELKKVLNDTLEPKNVFPPSPAPIIIERDSAPAPLTWPSPYWQPSCEPKWRRGDIICQSEPLDSAGLGITIGEKLG